MDQPKRPHLVDAHLESNVRRLHGGCATATWGGGHKPHGQQGYTVDALQLLLLLITIPRPKPTQQQPIVGMDSCHLRIRNHHPQEPTAHHPPAATRPTQPTPVRCGLTPNFYERTFSILFGSCEAKHGVLDPQQEHQELRLPLVSPCLHPQQADQVHERHWEAGGPKVLGPATPQGFVSRTGRSDRTAARTPNPVQVTLMFRGFMTGLLDQPPAEHRTRSR